MSRIEENLQRDLRQIADRATPSPDAWTQIQSRIADQEPIQETEIIMLTENTLTTRRWPLVAAAAGVVALAITGIALVNRSDDQSPADVPEPVPTLAPDGADDVTTDQQPDAAGAVSPLPAEGQPLPAGRYAPFTLGLPVTFEVPTVTASPWTVQVSNPVTINVGNDDGFVVFTRVGSLYDATQAQDPDMSGLGSIPPDNIDGWIEANDAVVVDSRAVTVDGRTAQFRQVTAPPGAGDATELCPVDNRPCLSVGSASADLQDTYDGVSTFVFGANPHSFWFVELDDFEPLAIWTSAVGADPAEWLAEVTPLIDSIELGEPAPAVEFGAARVSTFDATEASGELPEAGEQVEPGTYATGAIGVPVTLDVLDGQTGPWTLVSNDETGIQLISDDTGREFMAIGRVGSWFDAVESRTEGTRGLGSIPADGLDTWIESNGVIVVDSVEVQVGGRDAKYRLIRLDTAPGAAADFCPPVEAPCLWAASGSADLVDAESTPVPFGRDRVQALWSIDMGEFEPVFIFAAANLDDDGPWFTDIVQPIVDSIQFGEPAPVIEGGTARVPLRVTVSAAYSGVRTDEDTLADGSVPIAYIATSEGSMAGEIGGGGTYIVGGDGVATGSDEYTFTGTIDGIGSGSLTYTDEWTATGPTESSITVTITGGTGDFVGMTGTGVTTVDTSEKVGRDDTITGTNTFELVIPRSG